MRPVVFALLLGWTLGAKAAANPDLSKDLVLHLPFNGNAEDASGHGAHGKVHGAVRAKDRFGRSKHAYYFHDRDKDYIRLSPTAGLEIGTSDYSIAAWIRCDRMSKAGRIFSKGSFNCTVGYMLRTEVLEDEGHETRALLENSGPSGCNFQLRGGAALNDGRWHFVAGVVKRNEGARVYIDGLQASFEAVDTSGMDFSNQSPAYIGAFDGDTSLEPFEGAIDDVRVYARALSAEEVGALFHEKPN